MLGSCFYNLLSNPSIPFCCVSIPPGVTCSHPSSGLLWALHSAGRRRGAEGSREASTACALWGLLQAQTGPCTVPWEHPAQLLTHTVQDGHVSSANIF